MKVATLKINNNLITSLCVGLVIVGVVGYMYFLSLSVVHVVMRKEATQTIGHLRSEISSLEAKYIEAKHEISAKVATVDGFNQNQNKVFISRDDRSLVLRTSTE
jgi:hypothetical protein